MQTSQPRCQHYTFAHQALPQVFHENPLEACRLLASEKGDEFLNDLWDSVTKHCVANGREIDLDHVRFVLHETVVDDRPAVVIEMPPPRFTTEAYYICLLLADLVVANNAMEAVGRYFTLEYSDTYGGESTSVVCEWTSEGAHLNSGRRPAPDLPSFIAEIERLI